jgi:diguanylate cyclase (GGDEF)-like protein
MPKPWVKGWRWRLKQLRWRAARVVRAYVGHDPLTGLGTSAKGDRLLKRDLARGRSGAVIYCDLDNMRGVNHTNGHVLGDELLRLVAGVLTSRTPPGGMRPYGQGVYRMGGDEFLIRLPGVDEATAAALAQDAREKVRQLPDALGAVRSEGRPFGAHFTVAAWPERDAPSFVALMSAIDECLHGKYDTVERVPTGLLHGMPAASTW